MPRKVAHRKVEEPGNKCSCGAAFRTPAKLRRHLDKALGKR